MAKQYPTVSGVHKTLEFDSTRWKYYKPRAGDVIISTYAKCGTTWMQQIVLNLHYPGKDKPLLNEVSLWVERHDRRNGQSEQTIGELTDSFERIQSPRQFKTHLPLDYLPYYPEVKYLVVGRDMRDAWISWHNHLLQINELKVKDLRAFWRIWIDQGIEGNAPAATGDAVHPHFSFYNNWWRYGDLENIHLVHFNNLLGNLKNEIIKIAGFLEIEINDVSAEEIAKATMFAAMKKNSRQLLGDGNWLINQGTNGRWKEILTTADIDLYENAKIRAGEKGVAEDCLNWLESGMM